MSSFKKLKAIIIGASTGIGKALAQILSKNGYVLGLASRRENLLTELQKELPNKSFIKTIDIAKTKEAQKLLIDLIEEMGGVGLIIINAGTGTANPDLDWQKEKTVIDTNVLGFAAMAVASYQYFWKKGSGHIVGISSIAALIANPHIPSYSASKAFISSFLQGLSIKASQARLPITVTDIKPGFVDTPLVKDNSKMFWVASPEKAAKQIFLTIKKKKTHAYITKRWKIAACLIKMLPMSIIKKIR